MNRERLIDRYEPLESILSFYKRFGESTTLIRHIFKFISKNLKVKKEERKLLFNCIFNKQQDKEKKVKNFVADIAKNIDISRQEELIHQLIVQLKTQIAGLEEDRQRRVHMHWLNEVLYKQVNILEAFSNNERDFVALFELWSTHR